MKYKTSRCFQNWSTCLRVYMGQEKCCLSSSSIAVCQHHALCICKTRLHIIMIKTPTTSKGTLHWEMKNISFPGTSAILSIFGFFLKQLYIHLRSNLSASDWQRFHTCSNLLHKPSIMIKCNPKGKTRFPNARETRITRQPRIRRWTFTFPPTAPWKARECSEYRSLTLEPWILNLCPTRFSWH